MDSSRLHAFLIHHKTTVPTNTLVILVSPTPCERQPDCDLIKMAFNVLKTYDSLFSRPAVISV